METKWILVYIGIACIIFSLTLKVIDLVSLIIVKPGTLAFNSTIKRSKVLEILSSIMFYISISTALVGVVWVINEL
jgi:hypothetical protein